MTALENALEHYGVKGMRWGVRRDSNGSGESKSSKVKKAAIIFGSAVGAAAIAIGSAYIANQMRTDGDRRMADISTSPRADQLAKALVQEPVGIVHASRGRNKGFTFPQRGGLSEPTVEYQKAGFDNMPPGPAMRRYGERNEKVAARYNDPEGRRDFASRPIFHEVMLPESMAKGVHNVSDAERVSWPLIKDTYAALYGEDRD